MAFITINTPYARGGSFFKTARGILKAYVAHRKERADYIQMMRLSNRDLKDMGVTRDEVRELMMRKISWPGAV